MVLEKQRAGRLDRDVRGEEHEADGLTEAPGERMRYGTDRLARLLRESADLDPQATLEVVKRDLRDFASEQLTDDVCLLLLRA